MIKLSGKPHLLNSWVAFASISLIIALLLMLRPIPTIYSSNDTGRYLAELHYFCEGGLDNVGGQFRGLGRVLMYQLSGSCFFRAERFFLFLAAFSVPAAYLCFARWKRDDFIIALSATLSVYGFELMINALRSGIALFFLLGALQIGNRRLLISATLFGLAGALHNSLLIFFPLLYSVWLGSQNRRKAHFLAAVTTIIIMLQFILNFSGLTALYSEVANVGQRYALIYGRNINNTFVIFMISPLLVIFFARSFWDRDRLSRLEVFAVTYSMLILSVSYVIFPLVAYRFALLSVPIQLFSIIISRDRPIKAGKPILALLITHFLIMLAASSYYEELLS